MTIFLIKLFFTSLFTGVNTKTPHEIQLAFIDKMFKNSFLIKI